jgi:ubiquinone/menaquinone biosynthesis C-methylase UbiE
MGRETLICPWWLTRAFDNPLRRLVQEPYEILSPYVRKGMHVADLGCGRGYFTVALADLVGSTGAVEAVDLQERQLTATGQRCERAGLGNRVRLVRATRESLNITGPLDFVLAFAVVHEVTNWGRFFSEIHAACAPKGRVLVCEPKIHVPRKRIEAQLATAVARGFSAQMKEDAVRLSWTYLLVRR